MTQFYFDQTKIVSRIHNIFIIKFYA